MDMNNVRRAGAHDGASLVEFAMVIPLILLVVVGTFDLGWAAYANNTVALAAREGARAAIICSKPDADIKTQVKNTAFGLALTDSDILITNSPSTVSGCLRDPGQGVTVEVHYSYTPLTGFTRMWGNGELTISSRATMLVE
jgi:Flp pilus assembly protein TadG